MLKTLEHHEHAEHMAHGAGHGHGTSSGEEKAKGRLEGAQLAALLVATLAAGLALSEQGAKHAEIRVQANLIAATDAWAQYQAKSIRSTMSRELMEVVGVMEPTTSPEVMERRNRAIAMMKTDQDRFDHDPKDGKEAIAERAHEFEHERDHALEQTHAYHNGSAAMELGIVLTTASAIIGSKPLIWLALALGLIGAACSIAGMVKPEWGAF